MTATPASEYDRYPDGSLFQKLAELDEAIFRCKSQLRGVGPTGADPKPLHGERAAILRILLDRAVQASQTGEAVHAL